MNEKSFLTLPSTSSFMITAGGSSLPSVSGSLDRSTLTYDKDKQKVVPPGAFSDPATWKVIPPGEFRPQCARPVGLMWRDHWE